MPLRSVSCAPAARGVCNRAPSSARFAARLGAAAHARCPSRAAPASVILARPAWLLAIASKALPSVAVRFRSSRPAKTLWQFASRGPRRRHSRPAVSADTKGRHRFGRGKSKKAQTLSSPISRWRPKRRWTPLSSGVHRQTVPHSGQDWRPNPTPTATLCGPFPDSFNLWAELFFVVWKR
jgi:hypothetical protein